MVFHLFRIKSSSFHSLLRLKHHKGAFISGIFFAVVRLDALELLNYSVENLVFFLITVWRCGVFASKIFCGAHLLQNSLEFAFLS